MPGKSEIYVWPLSTDPSEGPWENHSITKECDGLYKMTPIYECNLVLFVMSVHLSASTVTVFEYLNSQWDHEHPPTTYNN